MNSDNKKINGWINLNKPEGVSSSKCVIILKKILNVKKIGHAGTLDPLASGVLPIAIGEATKSIRFVSDEHKTYTFKICWGVETSTDDKEGTIIRKTKRRPKEFTILQNIEKFIGEIEDRIKEDYLRIYRYFRFLGLFDQPDIDDTTQSFVEKYIHESLVVLTNDVIRQEVLKMFNMPFPLNCFFRSHDKFKWVEILKEHFIKTNYTLGLEKCLNRIDSIIN